MVEESWWGREPDDAAYDYVIAGVEPAAASWPAGLAKTLRFACSCSRRADPTAIPSSTCPRASRDSRGARINGAIGSVPQKHSNGRSIPLPQGRVLGGGGSINSQVFTRGVAEDYDGWAGEYGCEGWSAAEVSKYFVRSESNTRLSGPHHGTKGRSASRISGVRTRSRRHSCRRARSSGCPTTAISTGPKQLGVGFYQTTTRNGRRCSAAVAYLKPARRRPNLTVRVNVTVSKVVIKNGRAVGIQAIEGGVARTYSARREVLIASGAFGSPKLLQLSGIGDPADLAAAGIDVLHALPGVGKNLQDHLDLDIIYELTDDHSLDRFNRVRPATSWRASSTWPSARDRSRPTSSRPVASAMPTRMRRPRTCSSTSCPRRGRSRALRRCGPDSGRR